MFRPYRSAVILLLSVEKEHCTIINQQNHQDTNRISESLVQLDTMRHGHHLVLRPMNYQGWHSDVADFVHTQIWKM